MPLMNGYRMAVDFCEQMAQPFERLLIFCERMAQLFERLKSFCERMAVAV